MSSFRKIMPPCKHCYDNDRIVPIEISGEGIEKVFIMGESPYKTEVKKGRPFIGKAGRLLRSYFDLKNFQYVIFNSIMCMPNTKNNKPNVDLIDKCGHVRNFVLDMMLDGEVLITFGRYAQMAAFGKHVKFSDTPYFLAHPSKNFRYPVWANYHPMYALVYNPHIKSDFEDILKSTGKFKVK